MKDHGTLILEAAEKWWIAKRPIEWTEAQHIETPAVNTTTEYEKDLARSIGDAMVDYVRECKRGQYETKR